MKLTKSLVGSWTCLGLWACHSEECSEPGSCPRAAPSASSSVESGTTEAGAATELEAGVGGASSSSDAATGASAVSSTLAQDTAHLDGGAVNSSQSTSPLDAGVDAGATCGDGLRGSNEACDVASTGSSAECSSGCASVEVDAGCDAAGQPCWTHTTCGNAVIEPTEQCDDGNRKGNDGCSVRCTLEAASACEGEPSVCVPTVCGNAIVEGSESCDDGNERPFDGCSERCQPEPSCSPGIGCVSACGDGIVSSDEPCDDGNVRDHDGCSSACEVELGFTCEMTTLPCTVGPSGECIIHISAIYRDQGESHPDFGPHVDECMQTVPDSAGGGTIPGNVLTQGMLALNLDADGKPALVVGNTAVQQCGSESGWEVDRTSYVGVTQFGDWFDDSPAVPTLAKPMVLFDDGSSTFTNRLNDEGARFPGNAEGSELFDGASDVLCSWCFDGSCSDTCSAEAVTLDGSPLFFPVDSLPSGAEERARARISSIYGLSGAPFEGDLVTAVPSYGELGLQEQEHNFFFTTEMRSWFVYRDDTDIRISVEGNDDVWVFINGRLAVDLGGVHFPEAGSVAVRPGTAAQYGLENGGTYEIALFHAQRRAPSSSFRFVLSGTQPTSSQCTPVCGDGILAPGEQCDNGVEQNVGGYGECTPACLLDAYCGDGIVNGDELCDHAAPGGGEDCAPGCRLVALP